MNINKKIIIIAASVLLLAASCNMQPTTVINYPQDNIVYYHSESECEKQTNKICARMIDGPKEGLYSATTVSLDDVNSNPNAGLITYTSPEKFGFSVKYSNDFGFATDKNQIATVSYIPVCDDKMVACVYLGKDKYAGTNFDGAGVSVNIDSTLNTEAKCYNFKVSTNAAQTQVPDVTINGVVFKSATGGDAGAGHFDNVKVFRNFYNSMCYEIATHVGSTNIGNYPTGTVSQFDENAVWQKLQEVVNTFSFTNAMGNTGTKNFGEPVTLKKGQTVTFSGGKATLKLTDFYYHPCPKGSQCIWSGLDVFYELTVDGKVYSKINPGGAGVQVPYQVFMTESDYQTYATFVVK